MLFKELIEKIQGEAGGFKYAPYSPSKLDTASVCPGRFYATYVAKLPPTSMNQVALDKGSIVHYVLERIIAKRFNNEPFSMVDVDFWIAEAKVEFPNVAGDLLSAIEQMCYSMVQRSFEIPFYEQANLKAVEKEIAIGFDGLPCDYNDPFAFARGKMDVYLELGHHAYIIDHKTQKNWERPDTTKMLFYAWLCFMSNPDLRQISLILNFCDPILDRFSNVVTVNRWQVIRPQPGEEGFSMNPDDDFRTAEELICDQIARVEFLSGSEDAWPQIVNSRCNYCPAYYSCRDRKKHSMILTKAGYVPVENREQAESALKTLIVLEDYADHLKSELKSFIEREDVPDRMVRVGDQAFMKSPETHTKWNDADQQKLYDFIKDDLNQDPKLYLEWSSSKLKKLAAIIEDPRLEIKLKSIVPTKVVVKHGIKKAIF